MKKTQTKRIAALKPINISLSLAIMVVFLLCGVASGCIFSLYSGDINATFLFNDNLNQIVANGVSDYSFWKTYFNLVKYPAIVFLLGFTVLGVFAVPITVSVKGFFIAFSISSVIQTFGYKGFWASLAMFGLQTAASIPCLLFISSFSFEMSKLFINAVYRTKKATSGNYTTPGTYIMIFAFLAVLLLIFTLVDIALTPTLVSIAAKNILS